MSAERAPYFTRFLAGSINSRSTLFVRSVVTYTCRWVSGGPCFLPRAIVLLYQLFPYLSSIIFQGTRTNELPFP